MDFQQRGARNFLRKTKDIFCSKTEQSWLRWVVVIVILSLGIGIGQLIPSPIATYRRIHRHLRYEQALSVLEKWYQTRKYNYQGVYTDERVNWDDFTQTPMNNLLNNPGFEEGEGGKPDVWEIQNNAMRSGSHAHSGQYSLFLKNNSNAAVTYSNFSVFPNGIYTVSFWVRIQPGKLDVRAYAECVIRWFDNKGHLISSYSVPWHGKRNVDRGISLRPSFADGTDWIKYEEVVKAPLKARTARVTLRSKGNIQVYYDDIVFEAYTRAAYVEEGSLANPLYLEPYELPKTHEFKIELFRLDGIVRGANEWRAEIDGKAVGVGPVTFDKTFGVYNVPVELPPLRGEKHFINIYAKSDKNEFRARGQIMVMEPSESLLLGVVTDQHYFHQLIEAHRKYDENMEAIIDQLNAHNPDIVFILGDYDEDCNPPAHLLRDIETINAPVVIGFGNHEYDAYSELKHKAYLSHTKTYFSKSIGSYHFIVMDGNELNPDGLHVNTIMTQSQFGWIEDELSRNQDKNIYIFSEPAVCFREEDSSFADSYPEQAQKLQKLFETYKVRAVIQGDKHQGDFCIVNGVTYITITSPTRPFLQFPWAGYGLIRLEKGDARYAGTVDVFQQNNKDPYPPVVSHILWNINALPKYYYSERTLSIIKSDHTFFIDGGNISCDYEAFPFRVDSGTVYNSGRHTIDTTGKTIVEFKVPKNGGRLVFKKIGHIEVEGAFECDMKEYTLSEVKFTYANLERILKFFIDSLIPQKEYEFFLDGNLSGKYETDGYGRLCLILEKRGKHVVEVLAR